MKIIKPMAAIVVTALTLAGCLAKMPDGNGKLVYSWQDQAIMQVGSKSLIGQIETLHGAETKGGPSSFRFTQQLEVSDGALTCTTPFNTIWGGSFKTQSYSSKVTCSDGVSGNIQISATKWSNGYANNGFSGLGIGKLSNGKKLRLTFGPSINVTNTNF